MSGPPLRSAPLAAFAFAAVVACSDTAAAPDPVIAVAVVPATATQEAVAGSRLPQPLAVSVTIDGAAAPDIEVAWSASAGTLGRTLSRTDAAGVATSAWTLGAEPGMQTAAAAVTGAVGSPVSFSARALAPAPPPVKQLIGIGIGPASEIHASLGIPYQLAAQAYYDDGSVGDAPSPVWSVNDAAIATVSADGLLMPAAPGTTTVTLASAGLTATALIRVIGPTARLEVVAVPSTIFVGQLVHWTLRAWDAGGIELEAPVWAAWTSSAPSVVVALSGGTALGLSAGTAELTATVDGVSASATLTVEAVPDLSGRWQMAEVRETNTYPTYECAIEGTLDLEHATASGVLGGTYAMAGFCPQPGGSEIDMSGTVTPAGAVAGAEIVFEAVSRVRCRYLGTVQPGGNEVRGHVFCQGLPGTPAESEMYDGSFAMSR